MILIFTVSIIQWNDLSSFGLTSQDDELEKNDTMGGLCVFIQDGLRNFSLLSQEKQRKINNRLLTRNAMKKTRAGIPQSNFEM
jgi:hypothetical protein